MKKTMNWFKKTFAVEQEEDLMQEKSVEKTPSIKTVWPPANKPTTRTTAEKLAGIDREATPSPVKYSAKPTSTYSTYSSPTTSSMQSSTSSQSIYTAKKAPPTSKVHTFEPKSLDDAKKVIEYLNKKYAVLLNLENLDNNLSQRIVDVVTGALFLLDGTYEIVTDDIYLMAPSGVEISSPMINAKNSVDKEIESRNSSSSFKFNG